MVAQIVSFFQRTPRFSPGPSDWAQQELAEFYRVESALMRAGIRVGTDRGLSDENEPWFVFYRSDDGEVVIHFARIDGEYIIAGPAYEEIARGLDFTALVRNMIARHPLVRRTDRNDNVLIHPAALLIAVVGTAFFKTGEARASETQKDAPARPVLLFGSTSPLAVQTSTGTAQPTDSVQIPANHAVLILAAALLASDYKIDTPPMDPATYAAIQATAAALDFSGVPAAQTVLETSAASASAAQAAAVEAATAQHMSSVLTLMAVLTSMPSDRAGMDGVAPSEAALWSTPVRSEPLINLAAPAIINHDWSIDIRLSSGALPAVEAVQLVRGFVGDPSFKTMSVIEVTKLPDILADLISRGDHVYVNQTPAPAPTPAPEVPAEPDLTLPPTPETGEDAGPGEVAPPVGDIGVVAPPVVAPPVAVVPAPPPVIVAPVTPAPAPAPAPAPIAPPKPAFSSPDLVKQFIDYFVTHTVKVDVMVTGASIVMFDARVLRDTSQISHLSSLTFDFADGSSISLVGDHTSFLHSDFLS